MRNSKKLIAVIMTVALLASMMVPALAASYQTQADKLTAAGLMKGTAGTGLDTALTRAQGIEFTVRAMGKSAAAAALTTAEVTAALANVTDAATIPAWARNSAAYAVSMKITNGNRISADGKITYSATAPLSGKQFVTMMLRALGYTGITLDNCLDKAQLAGMLSASKVVAFGVKAQLTRDDAAYIIYETINNGLVADAAGITPTAVKLVNKLVADGALATTVAAANFTFVAPTPAPAAALTFSAVALNAKQFKLTFNQAINADDGAAEAFYAVDGKTVGDTTVQADGKSVVLTLAGDEAFGNNSTAKITVKKDFRTATLVKLAADSVVSDIAVFDTTFPTFDSVKAVGLKTLRLYYSEPVWGGSGTSASITASFFEVKSATYTWSVTKAVANNLDKYIELTLGTNLIDGTVNVKTTNNIKDYAGNILRETTIAYPFVKDTTAPTATIKSATTKEVVVKFTKPVYGDLRVAHSVKATYYIDAANVVESAAKDEFTFNFTSKPLPAGNVTIYVLPVTDKTVTDLYGNKFVETSLSATITIDTTAPVVSSTEVVNNTDFKVTFDEALDSTEAVKTANYTLKKVSDGTSVPFTASYADKVVTIHPSVVFTDNTAYELVVVKATDTSGNATTASITKAFTVGDNTNPNISSDTFAVMGDGKIYIYYSEPMNTTAMVNKANYLVDKGGTSSFVALGDNDTVTAVSSQIALIDINGVVTNPGVEVASAVVDLAGKKLSDTALSVKKTGIGAETFTIDTVEAIATNKIKITFTKEVSAFNASDIGVSNSAVALGIAAVDSISGKVVTITLAADLNTDATTAGAVSVAAIAAPATTKSIYGTLLGAGGKVVADKIAPVVTKTSDTYDVVVTVTSAAGLVMNASPASIAITYSEAMDWNSFSTLTYSVAGYSVTAVSHAGVKFMLTLSANADNTTALPAVTQVYNVKDANGNVLASGTTYASK